MNETEIGLRSSIRHLKLPLPIHKEEEAMDVVKQFLSDWKVDVEDTQVLFNIEMDHWRTEGMPTKRFASLLEALLKVCDDDYGDLFSKTYIQLHQRLVSEKIITFDQAIILLSELRLITHLAANGSMTSAKITKVLHSSYPALDIIAWREIQLILSKYSLNTVMSEDKLKVIYEGDARLEEATFADADLTTACGMIGEVAEQLGLKQDIADIFKTLASFEFYPYLQIIHLQCTIPEHYDHVLSTLYEFAPRGAAATWLFRKWDQLVSTGNPLLNNCKGVYKLDHNWASGKKSAQRPYAHLMVSFFEAIDSLSFSATRELASIIRRWMLWYIKYNTVKPTVLPAIDSISQLEQIVGKFVDESTSTHGVLEQRLVDAVAISKHDKESFKPRGLGDPVNVNNFSQKKLGDCDFQSVDSKTIVAYEAHGGRLTQVYLDGHMRSFKRTLYRRMEELETIAPAQSWKIHIYFIAHGFDCPAPVDSQVHDIDVSVHFVDFEEFWVNAVEEVDTDVILRSFSDHFITPLNNRRTPERVRQVITEWMAIK